MRPIEHQLPLPKLLIFYSFAVQRKSILRRTKTISAGQHLDLNSEHERAPRIQSYMPPMLSIPSVSSSISSSASPWLPTHRQVQIKSPINSPDGLYLRDSPAPITSHSSVEFQLTGAESDDIVRKESEMAQNNLLVRRTVLKRNAHPLKYIKRANVPVNSGSSPRDDYMNSFTDAEEIHNLKKLNSQ